ncbi:nuclear transport factor 2 family protein [Herbiconiux sp. CPCC 205716]|uniref:Nuclear transport factor 2 family protein n=1 Tax=Herbiconiux gentiana TaxID=2970912 RepID=A0ABT2GEA5_9MICO|nr:nuclear transport factor 2 family protein [Herbiconiux gentiana]MCS5713161.1 nuclear transport factor 2 family protein [Herbiconiux gentiana]
MTHQELSALVKRERMARDTAAWDELSTLYWPGAAVRVTWFDGTIEEFVDISRDQEQRGRGRGIHAITPVRVNASGDRATVESAGQILIRPTIDGIQCDVTSWCRFFSRFERRDGHWRMGSFDSIYCKDRIDTVSPGVQLDLDQETLASGRASYRHLRYLNLRAGYTVPDDLPGDDRLDLLEKFYADAHSWLTTDTRDYSSTSVR